MKRIELRKSYFVFLSFVSLVFWTYLIRIASNLRPIADEICVLSEWAPQDRFPPFHLSPRFFATIFTWTNSTIWVHNYFIGIVINFVLITFLSATLFKNFFGLIGEVLNIKQSIYLGFFFTPLLIVLIPPNVSAIYDTFLWFGGNWHVVGSLLLLNISCAIIKADTGYGKLTCFIVLISFWSETAAICVFAPLIVRLIHLDSKLKTVLLFAIPSSSIGVSLIFAIKSERILAVQKESAFDLNSILGIIQMSVPLFFRGLIVCFFIVNTWRLIKSREERIEYRLNNLLVLCLAISCLLLILTQYATYGTWRSSILYGICAVLMVLILYKKRLFNNSFTRMSSPVAFFILMCFSFQTIVTLNTYVSDREEWWRVNLVEQKSVRIENNSKKEYQAFLPSDYGGGDWIDNCFNTYIKTEGQK